MHYYTLSFHLNFTGKCLSPGLPTSVELEMRKFLTDGQFNSEIQITQEAFPTKNLFEAYFCLKEDPKVNWKLKLYHQEIWWTKLL